MILLLLPLFTNQPYTRHGWIFFRELLILPSWDFWKFSSLPIWAKLNSPFLTKRCQKFNFRWILSKNMRTWHGIWRIFTHILEDRWFEACVPDGWKEDDEGHPSWDSCPLAPCMSLASWEMTDSRSDNSLSSEDTRSDDMETWTRVHNIFHFRVPTRVSIESMIEQIVFE